MTDFNLHLSEIIFIVLLLIVFIAMGAKSARQLKASEELWKFALEGAGDGVWDWDIKNDIAHLSDRYKEMFGFTDTDIKTYPENWKNRIHPLDLVSVNDALNDYLDGKAEK